MNSQQDPGSHIFLIRIWSEGSKEASERQEKRDAHDAQDHKEWSGRVQHVLSGEARTFHDWQTLIELLLEMAETDSNEAEAHGTKIQEVIP